MYGKINTSGIIILSVLIAFGSIYSQESAKEKSGKSSPGWTTEFIGQVNSIQERLVSIQKAIPADKYSWKPAKGVRSFAELLAAGKKFSEKDLEKKVQVFGMEMTLRNFMVSSLNHLHEHLGQAIAYGRSNDITPPWSEKK